MRCPSCAADLPDDARFCIECGAPSSPAATGPTTVLAPVISGRACPHCGAATIAQAAFCMRCGERLDNAAPHQRARLPWRAIVVGGAVVGILLLLGPRRLLFGPGLMMIIGALYFAYDAWMGAWWRGLRVLLSATTLAYALSIPRLLVPGLILVIGLNILLSLLARARRGP